MPSCPDSLPAPNCRLCAVPAGSRSSWSPNTRAMNLPDSASSCATSARKALRLAPSAKRPAGALALPMAAMHSLPVKRPVPS